MSNYHRTNIRRAHLRRLRNEIDFKYLFRRLGWPWNQREQQVVFVCPECSESQTAVNPKTNLARCFRCARNWNPVDFTIEVTHMEFLETVEFLDEMLPRAPDPNDKPF